MGFFQNQYILFALSAVAIFTAYIMIVAFLRKNPLRERIRQVMPVDLAGDTFAQQQEAQSGLAMLCSALLTATGVNISKARNELYLLLWRAGKSSPDSVIYYVFFCRYVQPFFLASALFFAIRVQQKISAHASMLDMMFYLILLGLCAIMGVMGGKTYIKNRTIKRQAAIENAFPDVLDLLLICIEAGQPLDAALMRVCRELKASSPEITEELNLTRVELNVRQDRVSALTQLAERTGTKGFKILSAALIQSEQFGTSIAETLRTLAEEYRVNRLYEAENKAQRIGAIISLPIILFILPPIFIFILAPPIIRIQQQGGLFNHTDNNR